MSGNVRRTLRRVVVAVALLDALGLVAAGLIAAGGPGLAGRVLGGLPRGPRAALGRSGGAPADAAGWVAAENQRTGTTAWRIRELGPPHAIEGYADLAGRRQAGPVTDPITNMTEARWQPSLRVRVGPRWPPGAYLLKLVASSGAERYVPLTVTDASSGAALVLMNAVTTWQAYNDWGGRNLYWGPGGPVDYAHRSRVASFDRPYRAGMGAADFLGNELPLISLAEREGLDVTYWTDADLDRHPERPVRHRGLVSLGHDEYWSTAMRRGAERARDHGVNLAFLGANAVFRHIRLEPSRLGPDRHEVNYKFPARADPVYSTDRSEVTTNWREPPLDRPERALLGQQYECNPARADGVVVEPGSWLLAGTGLRAGSALPDLVGPEYDRVVAGAAAPRGVELLLHSPLRCRFHSSFSDVTWYTVASGGASYWRWAHEARTRRRLSAGGSEQPPGQLAALHHQLAQGLVEMAVVDHDPAAIGVDGEHRRLAQQLADERRAHALGPPHQAIETVQAQGQAAAVQLDQAPTAARIRQRHLDRQVDPARAGHQRRLQQIGPVAGEQEDHVAVGGEPVHLVQQLEQQRGAARLLPVALLGDQVDVLQHHHRRLQQPRHRAGPRDQPHLAAGQQHHRPVAHPASQVHGGERLAGARPAVQQDAAAQVATGGEQPLAMGRKADGVALHPLQHAAREHDVLPGHLGQGVEPDLERPEVLLRQRDHPAPVDAALLHPDADLGEEAARLVTVGRHHLHPGLGLDAALGRPADQHGQAPRAVADQQQPELQAGHHPVAVQGDVDVLHRADHRRRPAGQPRAARRQHVRQPETVEALELGGHPHGLEPAPLPRKPGVQRHLQVRVLGRLELPGHDRQRLWVGAEVRPEPTGEHWLGRGRGRHRALQEALEGGAEFPWRDGRGLLVGHGIASDARSASS